MEDDEEEIEVMELKQEYNDGDPEGFNLKKFVRETREELLQIKKKINEIIEVINNL